jgi:hypothetical protein
MDAVRYFAKDVTPPLLFCIGDSLPTPIGTASLLRIANQIFLVSAAHNYDEAALDSFAIPENRIKGHAIGLSGTLLRPIPSHRDLIDVAVTALTPECGEQVLAAGWRTLSIENVAPASDQGTFVLCGYPSANTTVSGDTIVSLMITAFTHRLPEPPKGVKFTVEPDPAVELFFHYDSSQRYRWCGDSDTTSSWSQRSECLGVQRTRDGRTLDARTGYSSRCDTSIRNPA